MAAATLSRQIGTTIKEISRKRKIGGLWYTPHMAAASRAIAERIPLVDLVVEVRDARIPFSSEYDMLRNYRNPSRQIIVLNKMDLAERSGLQAWMKFYKERNCISYGVNSHNKDNIRKFLSFLQARVRELKGNDHTNYTATIMLVGIPNVGKSALTNALHQIGRISAAEKGKLKHATVSPEPGETKDIRSFKVGSHPSIYVLDTPGVLPPKVPDISVCSKLFLTGAIRDCLVGEIELAKYFLAILNSSEQYKKWENLSTKESDGSVLDGIMDYSTMNELHTHQKKECTADHTQDSIVRDVRRRLFETISSFDGNTRPQENCAELISREFTALQESFQVSTEGEDAQVKVAEKLLNIFRTGRLGHYTLDLVPENGY